MSTQGANTNAVALVAALLTERDHVLLLDKQDIWTHILSFVGPGHYLYLAPVSKRFREIYLVFFSTIKSLPMVRHAGQQICLAATHTLYAVAFSSVPCAKYWDQITQGRADRLEDLYVCGKIAKHGNLQVLQWAHEDPDGPRDQTRFPWNEETCTNAAKNGHLELLTYAHSNGCPWISGTCARAAENGHLECLKYAHEKGCEWNVYTCVWAARGGHLDVLKWAHRKGCPWDSQTCAYAAENGHLEVLKWAHENGCEWDWTSCAYAAESGHLEILKWARMKGCPWNRHTIEMAEQRGQYDIAQWARDNGCPLEWD